MLLLQASVGEGGLRWGNESCRLSSQPILSTDLIQLSRWRHWKG
jgi:hypothetical protein